MSEPAWWQTGVIYQIYPRSFQDSNGDGVGDLAGIIARLAYLAGLGVDAIWLSPFYPSPMADFGYDISDYCDVDPLFGTLDDFDRLIAEAHRQGLRVIVDLVPNHTSIAHPWFAESRASRHSLKRDWYIWRDGKDGGPPNNWLSHFGGSAWTLDEASGQYYYHAYLAAQPDLNWRNPAVQAAMHEVMRFWLGRGVDGFRVDVMWHLIKDRQFRDNLPNPAWHEGRPAIERLLETYSADQPEVHAVVAGMRRVVDEFNDRVLIGEIYLPLERLTAYYNEGQKGAHLPFNFHLIETSWRANAIADLIRRYEAALPQGAWPNWVLGNHDRSRLVARVGESGARLAAMLLLTLRGTPTLYNGDEIAIPQVPIPVPAIVDPWGKSEPAMGRDPCRTPIAWDASLPAAGFSAGHPWLPLHDDWMTRNVAVMDRDQASLLNLYRALMALRRSLPALNRGSVKDVAAHEGVLSYCRCHDDKKALVFLNFSNTRKTVSLPSGGWRFALSTSLGRGGGLQGQGVSIDPQEGVILTSCDRPDCHNREKNAVGP